MDKFVRVDALGTALLNYLGDPRRGPLSTNAYADSVATYALSQLGDFLARKDELVALGPDHSPKAVAAALRGALAEDIRHHPLLAERLATLEALDATIHSIFPEHLSSSSAA